MQPLTEEDTKYFAEKYGKTYTDLMTFEGKCYGMVNPWGGTGIFKYNRTKCEDLGIKTPKEYYLEGNWTYETMFKFLNECTMDLDGDGKLDYAGMSKSNQGYYFFNWVKFDENGKLYSNAESDQVRDYIQMYYEGFQTGAIQNSNAFLSGTAPYVMSGPQQSYQYMIHNLMFVQQSTGDVIESCPLPSYKAGMPGIASLNYCYLMIPAGADYEQGVKIMDFIMECGLEDMDDLSYGEVYDFEGLTGCTEWTKTFLTERYAMRDELDAAPLALPEYDAEWTKTIQEHYANNVEYIMQYVLNGVDWMPENSSKNNILWTDPSATSIAQIHPVLQGQCEAFNLLYLDKE